MKSERTQAKKIVNRELENIIKENDIIECEHITMYDGISDMDEEASCKEYDEWLKKKS
jgi:uncharacterized protein (UPF0335 family)